MLKEGAFLFLKKMREDIIFRTYIESLGLDEQEKAAQEAGFFFTTEDLALAIAKNDEYLKNVNGGAFTDPDYNLANYTLS